MIPTRTLKFWGFKEHPFADNILRGDLLKLLIEHGESSASDDNLRKALGFKKSKRSDGYHKSVAERLRAVAERLRLEFDEVPTGNTKKKVLRISNILK